MDLFENDFKLAQQNLQRLQNQMENIKAAKDTENATTPQA